MNGFPNSQMDWVFFVCGAAFLLLADVCRGRLAYGPGCLPWRWLGLFGLTHGLNEWLGMLAISLGDSRWQAMLHLGLLVVAFACLMEFGRAGTRQGGGHAPGRWIILPFLVLAGIGGHVHPAGYDAAIRVALGLPAALWAAWALARAARRAAGTVWTLACAACAMSVYALAEGLVIPVALWPAAHLLDHSLFAWASGFPVQYLRGLLACCLATGVALHNARNRLGDHTSSGDRRLHAWLAGALLAVLACGWSATQWMGAREGRRQSARLLETAVLASAVVDTTQVARLTGTPADLTVPEYRRLKQQLRVFRQSMPHVRFVYLARKVAQQVIFLVDSEAPGSADESPPGQIYAEAPAELVALFQSGAAVTTRIYNDRWGDWLSAFCPVRLAGTDPSVVVMGVDQDAGQVRLAVARQRFVALSLTALLCLVILLSYSYSCRLRQALASARQGEAVDPLVNWAPVVIAGVAGMLLTLAVHLELRRAAVDDLVGVFRAQAGARVRAVARAAADCLDTLDELRRFHEVDEEVDRHEFDLLAGGRLGTGPVVALGWVPRIPGDGRADCEAHARQAGMVGFQIAARDAAGRPVPIGDHSAYFPLYHYVSRARGGPASVGWDLASDPDRWAAMSRACDAGQARATPVLQDTTDAASSPTFVVFAPVYARAAESPTTVAERRRDLRGFVMGVYSLTGLVNEGSVDARIASERTDLRIEDLSAPQGGRLRLSQTAPVADPARLGVYAVPLDMAGRDWIITVMPTEAFVAANLATAYRWVLPAGLLVSVLSGWLLSSLTAGRFRAERLVRIRTAELVQQHQATRESELRFATAFLKSPIAMLVSERESGRYTDANDAFLRLFEYARAEVVGHTTIELGLLCNPHDRERMLSAVNMQEGVRGWECDCRTKHGAILVCLFYATPVSVGDRPHLLISVLDVTERKLSKDRQEQMESLLRQEHRLAAVGTLAGGVANEINNPLCGMLGCAELIQERLPPDSPLREYAGMIISEGERVAGIVRSLGAFARPDGGKRTLVAWPEMIDSAVALVRAQFHKANLGLDVTLPVGLPEVVCNNQQIQQVLVHLLMNAREVLSADAPTEGADRTVRVTACVLSEPQPEARTTRRWVRVTVADCGPGMPDDVRACVFNPFFTTKSRAEHVGLGLASSLRIVQEHGGRLTFETQAGRGTRFHMDLPVAPVPEGNT